MCKDLTLEFIPLITEVITSWLKEGADQQFQIIPGEFDQCSMVHQHLNSNYESYQRFSISFEAKYGCLFAKCDKVNWTSTRGTLEFCYREAAPGVYRIIVRAFRNFCEKCKYLSDVEIDELMEMSNDRVLLVLAYEIRLLMEKNKMFKDSFYMSIKQMSNEMKGIHRIEPISKQLRWFHSMRENECCAC